MQKRHLNRQQYFKEQALTTEKHVIPYISEFKKIDTQSRILEIGCAEGGNMLPFLDMGCQVVGVDLNQNSLNQAEAFFKDHPNRQNLKLIYQNIYDSSATSLGTFDIIILRDVIEHIHDQLKFMSFVKKFLKKEGVIFFGFPPWQMPFGGHQQSINHKLLSKIPYTHLLPKSIYRGYLKLFKIPHHVIDSRLELTETGISIERMNAILEIENFEILKRDLFLINPNYEIKFGLKKRKQFSFLSGIPVVRNFCTTCAYYLVRT